MKTVLSESYIILFLYTYIINECQKYSTFDLCGMLHFNLVRLFMYFLVFKSTCRCYSLSIRDVMVSCLLTESTRYPRLYRLRAL